MGTPASVYFGGAEIPFASAQAFVSAADLLTRSQGELR
jgi:hypothetical protein